MQDKAARLDSELSAVLLQPLAAMQICNDFMTVTTGNGGSHAAKLAFGQYVGVGSPGAAFGRAALPQGAHV